LEEIALEYEGNPEPALLNHYQFLGYIGSAMEGTAAVTVLKALMLDKLAKLNTFNDASDACARCAASASVTPHRISEQLERGITRRGEWS
jgi:hypothetical protein